MEKDYIWEVTPIKRTIRFWLEKKIYKCVYIGPLQFSNTSEEFKFEKDLKHVLKHKLKRSVEPGFKILLLKDSSSFHFNSFVNKEMSCVVILLLSLITVSIFPYKAMAAIPFKLYLNNK